MIFDVLDVYLPAILDLRSQVLEEFTLRKLYCLRKHLLLSSIRVTVFSPHLLVTVSIVLMMILVYWWIIVGGVVLLQPTTMVWSRLLAAVSVLKIISFRVRGTKMATSPS